MSKRDKHFLIVFVACFLVGLALDAYSASEMFRYFVFTWLFSFYALLIIAKSQDKIMNEFKFQRSVLWDITRGIPITEEQREMLMCEMNDVYKLDNEN